MRSLLPLALLCLSACQSTATLTVRAQQCTAQCKGCCDQGGVCLLGTSAEACGAPGEQCSACGTGELCSEQRACRLEPQAPDAGAPDEGAPDAGVSGPDAGLTPCPPDGWCLDGLNAQGQPLVPNNLRSVWARRADDVWAVGDQGTILHFDGARWSASASAATEDLFGVWAAGANDVWAVGGSGDPAQPIGVVLHFDGAGWSVRERGLPRLDTVWGAAPNDVWFAGVRGALHHWDGTRITAVGSGTTLDLVDLTGNGAGRVWAVGASGVILAFDGATWSQASAGTGVGLSAALAFGPSLAWAAGGNGAFATWDGATWRSFSVGQDITVLGMWGAQPDAVWSAGPAGELHFFNGTTPVRKASPTQQLLRDLHGSDAQSVWAVGFGGTILRYRP